MQDGLVIKGLAPRRLDPCRYQIAAGPTLDDLEKNMPWRSIQDEFGKFKWLDHTHSGFLHLIITFEVMNGQPLYTSTRS